MKDEDIPPGSPRAIALGCTCEGRHDFGDVANFNVDPQCCVHGEFVRQMMADAAKLNIAALINFLCTQPTKDLALKGLGDMVFEMKQHIDAAYSLNEYQPRKFDA